jgi:hypothetical protein
MSKTYVPGLLIRSSSTVNGSVLPSASVDPSTGISGTIPDTKLAQITTSGKVSDSANADLAAATDASTVSTLAKRNGSGAAFFAGINLTPIGSGFALALTGSATTSPTVTLPDKSGTVAFASDLGESVSSSGSPLDTVLSPADATVDSNGVTISGTSIQMNYSTVTLGGVPGGGWPVSVIFSDRVRAIAWEEPDESNLAPLGAYGLDYSTSICFGWSPSLGLGSSAMLCTPGSGFRARWNVGSSNGASSSEYMTFWFPISSNYDATGNTLWNNSGSYAFEFPATVPSNVTGITYRSLPTGYRGQATFNITWQCGTGTKVITGSSTGTFDHFPGFGTFFTISTTGSFRVGTVATSIEGTVSGVQAGQHFPGDSAVTAVNYGTGRCRVNLGATGVAANVGLYYNTTTAAWTFTITRIDNTGWTASTTLQIMEAFTVVLRTGPLTSYMS